MTAPRAPRGMPLTSPVAAGRRLLAPQRAEPAAPTPEPRNAAADRQLLGPQRAEPAAPTPEPTRDAAAGRQLLAPPRAELAAPTPEPTEDAAAAGRQLLALHHTEPAAPTQGPTEDAAARRQPLAPPRAEPAAPTPGPTRDIAARRQLLAPRRAEPPAPTPGPTRDIAAGRQLLAPRRAEPAAPTPEPAGDARSAAACREAASSFGRGGGPPANLEVHPSAPGVRGAARAGRAAGLDAPLAALAVLLLLFAGSACGDDAPSPPTTDAQVDAVGDTDKPPADTAGPTNQAPELKRIGDRIVAVGQQLVITMEAHDPDGDELTYSVFGNLPVGARFDKAVGRFEWTPTEAGIIVFLTFVASDGLDFARETVRIQVTEDAEQHPPRFLPIGDQQVTAGVDHTLQLQATDADGDVLTYGHEGQLPAGATLDEATGLFRWRPDVSLAGSLVRVTFTVSDGVLSDAMAVRFVVTDGQGGGPHPPVFAPIASQTATAGQLFTLTLVATDPDGDPITFSLTGDAPPGSVLQGATFRWTPAENDAGRTFQVTFAATDGTFTVYKAVAIQVQSAQVADCVPDADEPNDTFAEATPITPGSYERTICESPGVYDVDVYAIAVPAGRRLEVTLAFDASQGDLDLYLSDGDAVLAASELVTSPEHITWTEPTGRTLYIIVIPYGPDPVRMGYTLTVAIEDPATDACVNDAFEPNDTPAQARPFPTVDDTLKICPGDVDWWSLSVACGEHLEIGMQILNDADLDLRLWSNPGATGSPLAVSFFGDPFEYIEIPAAPVAGSYRLQVTGWPTDTARGPYQLIAFASGGCVEDAFDNGTSAAAVSLAGSSGSHPDLRLCCRHDWFALDLSAGAEVALQATRAGQSGTLGLRVYAADGVTQLHGKAPQASSLELSFTAEASGRHLVRVEGQVGTAYGLSWSVSSGTGGCTLSSCPIERVCDTATGSCVSDFCDAGLGYACPAGYICRDTYCVDPCASDADCRPGYACKSFDVGPHCGIEGDRDVGGDCWWHSQCLGALICGPNGKCAP